MPHGLHQHKSISHNILVIADKIVKICFNFFIYALSPRSGVLCVWSSSQILRCRSIKKETLNILLRDAGDKITMFETSLALNKHFSISVIIH